MLAANGYLEIAHTAMDDWKLTMWSVCTDYVERRKSTGTKLKLKPGYRGIQETRGE